MENASKALIIAGAILIAILLISVGILVMNSINAPLEEGKGKADTQAIQMFNSKYQQYSGRKKTADDAKDLVMLIYSNTDKKHKIGFYVKNGGSGDVTKLEQIDNKNTYDITIYTMDSDGSATITAMNPAGKIHYTDDTDSDGHEKATGEPGYVYMVRIQKN